MSTVKDYYYKECVPQLMEQFSYKNIMEVPQLDKIVLNMGLGEGVQNTKSVDLAAKEMTLSAGQKAVVTKAKKSIATFKLRQGMPIGCRVTLRKERMYEFMDRLINLAIPRVKDFRGLSPKSFDGRGNYSMGVDEQSVFPEIDLGHIDVTQGMNITFVTSAETNEGGYALLHLLGMPFVKQD